MKAHYDSLASSEFSDHLPTLAFFNCRSPKISALFNLDESGDLEDPDTGDKHVGVLAKNSFVTITNINGVVQTSGFTNYAYNGVVLFNSSLTMSDDSIISGIGLGDRGLGYSLASTTFGKGAGVCALEGSNLRMSGVAVKSNAGSNVYANGSDLWLDDCDCTDSRRLGIELENISIAKIRATDFNNNVASGFGFDGRIATSLFLIKGAPATNSFDLSSSITNFEPPG